jgi:hypothetical protein
VIPICGEHAVLLEGVGGSYTLMTIGGRSAVTDVAKRALLNAAAAIEVYLNIFIVVDL